MHRVVITNRLRELRFRADEMTQQDLADRVGIARQTVIALERGKYYPSLELAFSIALAFGVALEEVFQRQDDATRRSDRTAAPPVASERIG